MQIRMLSFQGHHFFPFQPKLTPQVLQVGIGCRQKLM
jgi:hypothetical protein